MRQTLALAALVVIAACSGPVGNDDVPEPAKTVDLQRYQGRWHEFAR